MRLKLVEIYLLKFGNIISLSSGDKVLEKIGNIFFRLHFK